MMTTKSIFAVKTIRILGVIACMLFIMNTHDAMAVSCRLREGDNTRPCSTNKDGVTGFTDVTDAFTSPQNCTTGKCYYAISNDDGGLTKLSWWGCATCPSGYYREVMSAVSNKIATICDVEDHDMGIRYCSPCPAGSANGIDNATQCWPCSAGKYQNLTGQSSCKSCASGTYQNLSGSTSCKPCPENATCTGTGNTTFTCNTNYEKNAAGTGCEKSCSTSKACSTWSSEYNLGTYDECTGNQASACYKNVTRGCTQEDGSTPTNCYSVTAWNSCSCAGSTYKLYANGSTDGETSNETCTKTPNTVTAKSGYRVNGTSCSSCPTAYPNSANGNTGGYTACYKNVTRGCTQNDGSTPTNCYSVTAWNACSCAGNTYKQYSNNSGTGDGETEGTTSNETCTKTPKTVTAKSGYRVNGTACSSCPTAYPSSANGNTGGYTACYTTKTASCTQNNGSTPTNCASVTAWNSCSCAGSTYKQYSNSDGNGNGKTEGTTAETCTKTPKTVTANANSYVDGTSCKKCSSFSSTYTKSDGGNIGSGYCYTEKTKTGSQVNGSTPTNCYSVTSWNSCTPGTCTYRDYYSATDTTCTPTNCTKTPAAVTAKSGYRVNGTACSSCPTAYPSSANGNTGGYTACYKNVTRGCTQYDGTTPTNCDSATWNPCSCAGNTYKQYSNSSGNGNGTTDGETSNETCTKTSIKSVTAKANYYASGTSCQACPTATDIWTSSALSSKVQYKSSAGATSVGQCCLPTGTYYYDTKGRFKFPTQCCAG